MSSGNQVICPGCFLAVLGTTTPSVEDDNGGSDIFAALHGVYANPAISVNFFECFRQRLHFYATNRVLCGNAHTTRQVTTLLVGLTKVKRAFICREVGRDAFNLIVMSRSLNNAWAFDSSRV